MNEVPMPTLRIRPTPIRVFPPSWETEAIDEETILAVLDALHDEPASGPVEDLDV